MVANVDTLALQNTEIARMQSLFQAQKGAFSKDPYPDAATRVEHLQRIKPALLNNLDALCAALNDDFGGRSDDETKLAEFLTSLESIKYYAKNLTKWMKPQRRKVGAGQWPGSASVIYQPLGVVGVLVPWNYPLYLVMSPLVGALAAGNRVMIKTSEFTPKTGALIRQMLAEIFPEDQVAVISGEADVAQAFTQLPFDHILFTGSTSVGRHVMRAAAENLTPVTLELGGKSPCVIGADFPMEDAVERIAFGKCFNAGQTCVAPDYILCPQTRIEKFVTAFTAQVSKMYPTMRDNRDVTSVINERQHSRLLGYLKDAEEKGARIIQINPANEDFSGSRKIPFTLLLNVTDEMDIAQNEIFGPLLMVQSYDELDDALRYINARPKPLALYYFDWNKDNCDQVLNRTHSGGVCINDTVSHVGVEDIPFGGIGSSGMGHYHGHEGFLTFSHAKGVYRKGRINGAKHILPPYGRGIHRFIYKHLLK